MSAALFAFIAAFHAEPMPDWDIDRIEAVAAPAASDPAAVPEPPPTTEPPRVIVRFAEGRVGGSGVSWSAGPSVDYRMGPHTSLGGSGLIVVNGYVGTDLGLSACAYAKRFEQGFYGRFGVGTSWLLSINGVSGAGRLTAGPAWRFQLGEQGERGMFGVLDLGFELRGEAGFGSAPLEGASIGAGLTLSGGLGL